MEKWASGAADKNSRGEGEVGKTPLRSLLSNIIRPLKSGLGKPISRNGSLDVFLPLLLIPGIRTLKRNEKKVKQADFDFCSKN